MHSKPFPRCNEITSPIASCLSKTIGLARLKTTACTASYLITCLTSAPAHSTCTVFIIDRLGPKRIAAWKSSDDQRYDTPGPSYLLSTVLAVTQGRGTTLAEAIDVLERAASADGKGEKATFYFSDSSDVRSTTRSPLFKDAAAILRDLGHNVIIDIDRLPQKQSRLMGVMLGSANYDWPAAQNQMLPGAIAENLTSTSGVLHQNNDQTSMVELLRGGAAATSGTVTEPFALQFKFPTPHLFAYYAAGLSLAESFYLAVESPYQLLIVGDPLCRPYGVEHASKFEIARPQVMTRA